MEFGNMGELVCEERKRDAYNYVRLFTANSGGIFSQYKVLEIKIQDFSQVYLPPQQTPMYLKLFSSAADNGEPLPLHQAPRADEKCASICITTTSVPPYQLEPLKYEKDTKRKTQYIILELASLEAFLANLPNFVNDVLPWMESSANGTSEERRPSPYSTYKTKKQLRSSKTLRVFEACAACLEMHAVMFENSNSINLRYKLQDESKSGIYLPRELCDFMMEEREPLLEVLGNIKATSQWKEVDRSRGHGDHNDDDMDSDDGEGMTRGQAWLKRKSTPVAPGLYIDGAPPKRIRPEAVPAGGHDEVNTQRVAAAAVAKK
jgi:hypothetical protein